MSPLEPLPVPPPAMPPAQQAAPEPAAYANHFEVGFNAFEFLLDFAQSYDSEDGLPLGRTRIVTAPGYAKQFRELLDRSIFDYEASFGPIGPGAGPGPVLPPEGP